VIKTLQLYSVIWIKSIIGGASFSGLLFFPLRAQRLKYSCKKLFCGPNIKIKNTYVLRMVDVLVLENNLQLLLQLTYEIAQFEVEDDLRRHLGVRHHDEQVVVQDNILHHIQYKTHGREG
jgi:hypothetical protein